MIFRGKRLSDRLPGSLTSLSGMELSGYSDYSAFGEEGRNQCEYGLVAGTLPHIPKTESVASGIILYE